MGNTTNTKREFKDRLFKKIFSDKKALLSLYNAVNGSHYDNPEKIEYNTIEDYVYMGMKNDLSFVLTDSLNLYEQQSTPNVNIPFRGFMYLAKLYQKMFADDVDLYSSKRIMIPLPQFIVFYIGQEDEPDVMEMKLSDSFEAKDGKIGCLECRATLLNINHGHNRRLMEHCEELNGYAILVYKVRKYLKDGVSRDIAVDNAVMECIEEGILKDLLIGHRAEVKDMLLSEYNEELHIKNEKEISESIGEKRGIKRGIKIGEGQGIDLVNTLNDRLVKDNRIDDLKRATVEPEFQKQLIREYGLGKID